MSHLRRMARAALLAGAAAGLMLGVLQAVWVTPLILEAESYERGGPPAGQASMPDGSPPQAGWAPAEALPRIGLTLLSDLLTGVGCALLLVAGMSLQGPPHTVGRGLLWGAGGYVAFVLAPALGMPPELPGAHAAELAVRQLWWAGTVAATAAGLAVLAFVPRWTRLLGGVLLLAPHAVGSPPVPVDLPELLPAALAAHFVAAVLVTLAPFWAVLGATSAWLLSRRR